MITGVNKRHKSEGGTYRVTGKKKKVQLVLKEKVKWTRREIISSAFVLFISPRNPFFTPSHCNFLPRAFNFPPQHYLLFSCLPLIFDFPP